MDNITFYDSEGHIYRTSAMVDEHVITNITEKTPVLSNIGKIVRGDTNSNILDFQINRFYDGVDLYTKNIRFIIKNQNDIFVEDAVNVMYNDDLLRFSWIMSYAATQYSGTITVAIQFYGIEEDRPYVLKTLPFIIKIEDSLDANDMYISTPNWFVEIENRLNALEYKVGINNEESSVSDYDELNNLPQINGVTLQGNKTLNELGIQQKGNYLSFDNNTYSKIFVGTKAECEQDIAEGKIIDGMLVNITDDY